MLLYLKRGYQYKSTDTVNISKLTWTKLGTIFEDPELL